MSRFNFNPSNHSYTLDGKRLTGVTTIIGVLDKPALVAWSANTAVDYIKQNSELIKGQYDNWTYIIQENKLEEARNAWSQKRDKAGDIGTTIHNAIEEYVKSKINNQPEPILTLLDDARKMFEKFKEWEKEHDVKFLLSEQKLYSEKHWFAGTVDLVVEIKGKKFIADIKTAKDIYTTNYIQMAGYHIALEELGKVKDLEGYIVINLPKEIKKNGKAKFKEKRIYNTADFRKAFLNCLELYKFLNKEKPAYLKKKIAVSRSSAK